MIHFREGRAPARPLHFGRAGFARAAGVGLPERSEPAGPQGAERDPPVCMDIGIGLRVKNVSAETDIFQSRKIVADLIVSMAVWRDMVVRMYLRFPAGIATPSPTGRVATGLPANSSNTAT